MESVQISEPEERDIKPILRSEETRIANIINATKEIEQTKAWSTLKTEVFDSLVNVLEKDLKSEAEKPDVDPQRLNRISGELKWARKFSDLKKFENEKTVELKRIRLQLYGKSE